MKEGNAISIGRVILLYDVVSDNKTDLKKLKASQAGTVHRIVAQEGDVVHSGYNWLFLLIECAINLCLKRLIKCFILFFIFSGALFELKECSHPTVMKDMCAECGADLRKEDMRTLVASVPMVHSVPELKVSEEVGGDLSGADSSNWHFILVNNELNPSKIFLKNKTW